MPLPLGTSLGAPRRDPASSPGCSGQHQVCKCLQENTSSSSHPKTGASPVIFWMPQLIFSQCLFLTRQCYCRQQGINHNNRVSKEGHLTKASLGGTPGTRSQKEGKNVKYHIKYPLKSLKQRHWKVHCLFNVIETKYRNKVFKSTSDEHKGGVMGTARLHLPVEE